MPDAEAIAICRAFAGLWGEYQNECDNLLAEALTRVLVRLEVSEQDLHLARETMQHWALPVKLKQIDRMAVRALDRGWEYVTSIPKE